MDNHNSTIRTPAASGQFYPSDPKKLSAMIDQFLSMVDNRQIPEIKPEKIKAIIAPHAGYIFSGIVAAYAYKLLAGLEQENDYKIILLGPSHFAPINKTVSDPHHLWQTPLGQVRLIDQDIFDVDSIPHQSEHSLEVQVPFLQKTLNNFSILPLVYGNDNPKILNIKLKQLLKKNTILIISSDLSHYLPYKDACALDRQTCDYILKSNIDALSNLPNCACGLGGILTLMHLAKQLNWQPHLLKYANSGNVSFDKSQVVGYASFAYV